MKLRTADFGSARVKIERAYRHIDELHRSIDRFMETDFYRVTVKNCPDTNTDGIFVEVDQMPADIPLTIGDAVHNLRCALDHSWNALVRAALEQGFIRKDPRENFVIHKERQNVKSSVNKASIKLSFPDIEALIMDRIKPWKDGNECIWAVSQLDNRDKHNLLIITLQATVIRNVAFISPDGASHAFPELRVYGPASTFLYRSESRIELQSNANATFEVRFAEGEAMEGQSVLPNLLNLAEATSQTVQAFIEVFADGEI